jgi:hypothetical protein
MTTVSAQPEIVNARVEPEIEIDLKTHGEIAVMGESGDTKVLWSRENPDEIESARKTFRDLKAKGFAAFKCVGKNGDQGEQVDTFDPNAERYIFVPPMRGG